MDRSEFDTLATQKADVSSVEEMLGAKVDRSEFDTLATEKADVSSVEEMLGAKVDRSEFDTLATQKADVSAVEEMLGAKVDRSEFESMAERKVESDKLISVLKMTQIRFIPGSGTFFARFTTTNSTFWIRIVACSFYWNRPENVCRNLSLLNRLKI